MMQNDNGNTACPFCGCEKPPGTYRCERCHVVYLAGWEAGRREARTEARAALLSIKEAHDAE